MRIAMLYILLTLMILGSAFGCEVYKWHRFKEICPKATLWDFVLFGGR